MKNLFTIYIGATLIARLFSWLVICFNYFRFDYLKNISHTISNAVVIFFLSFMKYIAGAKVRVENINIVMKNAKYPYDCISVTKIEAEIVVPKRIYIFTFVIIGLLWETFSAGSLLTKAATWPCFVFFFRYQDTKRKTRVKNIDVSDPPSHKVRILKW